MSVNSGRQGTPFPYEGPVPAGLLIDRQAELDLLARRAGDRVNVRLTAPRRYGKTSVVMAHAERLRAAGWRTVHVDFGRAADLTDVARRVAEGYAALDSSWVKAHLASLLSRLGLTLTAAGPGVTLGPRPARSDVDAAEGVLLRLLDLPKRLWERDETPTLVAFDEFQDLLVARKDLDGLLRSQIQYHGDAAAYVFAGSEPSMMRRLFDERERPLFGQADPLSLGPLPLDETLNELAARFAAEQLEPADALGHLVAFAQGHPQRTMWLCYVLADALADGEEPTPALAAAVIDRALDRAAPAFTVLWQQSDATRRAVLAAVADGVGPTSRALAAEHNVAHSTLGDTANTLVDTGVLVRDPDGYRVVDPLLAEWLRRR
jgi:hypothetical protein